MSDKCLDYRAKQPLRFAVSYLSVIPYCPRATQVYPQPGIKIVVPEGMVVISQVRKNFRNSLEVLDVSATPKFVHANTMMWLVPAEEVDSLIRRF